MKRVIAVALLAAFLVPATAVAEPQGQWHLDADNGSTPDSSGHNLNGVTTGIGLIGDGRFGKAFRFDFGSSVRVPDSSLLEPQKLSVVAWVRYGAANQIPGKYVVAKGGDPGCTNPSYALATGPGGGLVFFVRDAATTNGYLSPAIAPAAIWDGDWHAVTGTYDGARVRLYLDGAQVGTGTATTTAVPYGRPDDSLTIGTYPQCAGTGYDFPGDVDEVRVYNRAISLGEVQLLHDPAAMTPPVLPVGGPPPPVTQPPRNLTPPSITAGVVRRLYRCDEGTWTGNPTSFTYRWYRDLYFSGDPQVATTPAYTVPEAHLGYRFYCVVTARNRGGSATAYSPRTLLSGLPAVPPTVQGGPPYGNVAIRGIDVLQTTQANSGSQAYGVPTGAFPNFPGGGTPITTPPSQRVDYEGVSIDADKPATAVVYVNMLAFPAASATQRLEVTLSYLVDGKKLGSQTHTITNPAVANSVAVTAAERDNPAFGEQFDIPFGVLLSAVDKRLDLQADVTLPAGDLLRGARQCNAACDSDDRFRLDRLPVFRLPVLTIFGVELLGQGQAVGSLAPAATVMQKAFQLWPGGERMVALNVGHIDVGFEQNLSFADHECTDYKYKSVRSCRQAYINERVARWKYDVPAKLGPYQALLGVMNDPNEPGWKSGTTTTLAAFDPKISFPPSFYADDGTQKRPITAAAHEFGHVLSAPHADTDPTCGGNSNGQVGETWPPDLRGRLQGVVWDRTVKTGGKIDPVVDTPSTVRYDLMSYCASTDDSDSWLSPRNWNRAFQVLLDLEPVLKAAASTRAPAAASDGAFAVGVVGPSGGAIREVVTSSDRVPPAVAASPVRVRSFDASGALLQDAGAQVETSSDGGSGGTWVAPVAARAASVVLVRGGAVLDRRARSGAPRVRLRSVRGHRGLAVRWTASDPDGDPLHATVDYAPDGRRWLTVFDGPSRGRASLRAADLAGGRRARVRVNVSDGFGEAHALSQRLRVRGTRPIARILGPGRGDELVAGQRIALSGQAVDDRHALLHGRSLTWFAGARRLGRGEQPSVRLPAGRVRLRLVARDARGLRTTVTRRLRVAPVPLRLENVNAPRHVKRGARTVRIRLRVSTAAILRAGGRRHRLRARSERIAVRLPRSPRTGLVHVPLRLTSRGGRIRTELTLVRG